MARRASPKALVLTWTARPKRRQPRPRAPARLKSQAGRPVAVAPAPQGSLSNYAVGSTAFSGASKPRGAVSFRRQSSSAELHSTIIVTAWPPAISVDGRPAHDRESSGAAPRALEPYADGSGFPRRARRRTYASRPLATVELALLRSSPLPHAIARRTRRAFERADPKRRSRPCSPAMCPRPGAPLSPSPRSTRTASPQSLRELAALPRSMNLRAERWDAPSTSSSAPKQCRWPRPGQPQLPPKAPLTARIQTAMFRAER